MSRHAKIFAYALANARARRDSNYMMANTTEVNYKVLAHHLSKPHASDPTLPESVTNSIEAAMTTEPIPNDAEDDIARAMGVALPTETPPRRTQTEVESSGVGDLDVTETAVTTTDNAGEEPAMKKPRVGAAPDVTGEMKTNTTEEQALDKFFDNMEDESPPAKKRIKSTDDPNALCYN